MATTIPTVPEASYTPPNKGQSQEDFNNNMSAAFEFEHDLPTNMNASIEPMNILGQETEDNAAAAAQSALEASYVQVGSGIGRYEDDLTLTDYSEFVTYGVSPTLSQWKLDLGVAVPYSVDSATYPNPEDDPNLVIFSGCCRAEKEINAMDFGALPSLTEDNTAAFNAMFDEVRDAGNRVNPEPGTGQLTALKIVIPPGVYLCNGSINATMLQFQGWTIKADGAVIYSNNTGGVGFDLLGSRYGNIFGLMVVGASVNRPRIGIQTGRTDLGVSADNLSFSQCKTGGYFTLAGVYNFASETEQHDHPAYYNYDDGIDSFGLLIDGRNMFDCQSEFVTQNVPVGTGQSCIQHKFDCADIRKPNGGPAIGLVRCDQVDFATGYAVSVDDYAVRFYEDDHGMRDINMDIHSESGSAGLLGVLDFRKATGTVNPTSVYHGFRYREHSLQATNRVINVDPAIADLKLHGSIVIDDILPTVGAPPNGLVIPGGKLHIIGMVQCPAVLLKGNFELDGVCVVDSIAGGSYGVGNYLVVDDSGTTIHKGNKSFRGNRSQTYTGSTLVDGEDTTLRDSSIEFHPLSVQPPLSGTIFAVDDGSNWSGVNVSGSPRPVFYDGSSWVALV